MAEYDIGVCSFAVNEEKFIGYSIRSFMACKAVKMIVVVEGCVKGYPRKDVSSKGLSTDGTADIVRDLMKRENGGKIKFIQAGWVNSKKDLQNHGFQAIRQKLGEAAIYMLAGADELYHPHELVALQGMFKANPRAKIVLYPFYHFWWRPDLVCVGSSWSVLMHRAYRRPGLPMIFGHHAAPPADCGKGPRIHAKNARGDYIVKCYHYTGMHDKDKIDARLQLYKERDGHRLRVADTWNNWRWGLRTQWTHGGGSVRRFNGGHPAVIEPDVWKLTPRGINGELLPLPKVPWDEDDASRVVTPPKRVGVFIEGRAVPDNQHVTELLDSLSISHHLEVYTLNGDLDDASQYGFKGIRKFDSRELNRNDLVLLFPTTYAIRPPSSRPNAPHVAVLYKDMQPMPDLSGYTVFKTPDCPIEGLTVLPSANDLVDKGISMVKEGRVEHVAPPPRKTPTIVRRPVVRDSAGIAGEVIPVRIRNVTGQTWRRGDYLVGAFWCDSVFGKPHIQTPRTKADIPRDVPPNSYLEMEVPMPTPPQDGNLLLRIDILDTVRNFWLGLGPQVPCFIRGGHVYGGPSVSV